MTGTGHEVIDGVVLAVIIGVTIVTIVGNGAVMLAWWINARFRSPQNLYLTSLAFVDFLIGVTLFPADIGIHTKSAWVAIHAVCKLRYYLAVTLCHLSAFHLAAISVDRFRVISEGVGYIQNRTNRSVLRVVAYLWIFATWGSARLIFEWRDDSSWKNLNGRVCSFKSSPGWTFHLSGKIILPTLLIVLMYCKIYIGLKQRIRNRTNCLTSSPDPSTSKTGGKNVAMDASPGTSGSNSNVEVEDLNEPGQNDTRVNCRDPNSVSFFDRFRKKNKTPKSGMVVYVDVDKEVIDVDKPVNEGLALDLSNSNKKELIMEKERKNSKTLGLLIGAYLISFLPYIFALCLAFFVHVPAIHNPTVYSFLVFLVHVNSGVNPIIYCFCNEEFRNSFGGVSLFVRALPNRVRSLF